MIEKTIMTISVVIGLAYMIFILALIGFAAWTIIKLLQHWSII